MAPQPIVFFGSSQFSTVVLNRILNTEHRISAVITSPDKPVGRHLKMTPNPVKVFAEKNNIPVFTSMNHELITMNSQPVGLVAAYGQIIKQDVLDQFHGQIYNIHPSLLPKYRGPSPLQQQILDGVVDTGVTIIQLDDKMDHGPIVAVAHDKILPDDTTISLGNRLFEKGADLFLNLPNTEYRILNIQNEAQATYTKKLTRQDGFLPWEEFNKLISPLQTKNRLEILFRALHPWPGVWTLDSLGKRLKLVAIHPLLVQFEGQPHQPILNSPKNKEQSSLQPNQG